MTMATARLSISPGGLLHEGETGQFSTTVAGTLILSRNDGGRLSELHRIELQAGEPFIWSPPDRGLFLARLVTEQSEELHRMVSVVSNEWAVCQITVGAFTAEDFADIIHGAGVAADYYVTLPQRAEVLEFSAVDPRWPAYERLFGDAIHPHVMAESLGTTLPECAHDDPNWDTLSLPEIERRLRSLQAWWEAQGYLPLDRMATYTPCNPLTAACRATGIRVIHSLCAEQNWSDGEWVINHWGMPTAPYWIAPDDFRKAGHRDDQGVLGIIMNHYQVLLPHLTRWGDFVLSPSHFTRWLRAADAGPESTRFRQFLSDTVRGGTSLTEAPFFFIAGFEFGRTFGTANMTDYNRAGLRRLIELSGREKLVFATSGDVRAYYERHISAGLAERAFRQRDSWVGVTVNGKPGQAGDSVVIERSAYKALVREKQNLPFFHYDYQRTWDFSPADTEAPDDFAVQSEAEVSVQVSPDRASISASSPLTRAVPVVLWDADIGDVPFERLPLRSLDDGRRVVALEIPQGWQGTAEIALSTFPYGRNAVGPWIVQSFGEGAERHVYLHLAAPLTRDVKICVKLSKPADIDSAQRPLGRRAAGSISVTFGPLTQWYRFWGCDESDIEVDPNIEHLIEQSGALLPENAEDLAQAHFTALDLRAWDHPSLRGGRKVFSMYCGAKLMLGTRSRAAADDWPTAYEAGISAQEFSDGVISFGPGRAFWYHPRTLHFRIDGITPGEGKWAFLLHAFDPLGMSASYRVSVGRERRSVGLWVLPKSQDSEDAFFPIELDRSDFDEKGRLFVQLMADQKPLVHWWEEGGFIAALHAFWLTRRD